MATVTRNFQHTLSIAVAKMRCDQALAHYRKLYPFYTITVDWKTATEAKVNIALTPTLKIACDLVVSRGAAKLDVTYPNALEYVPMGKKMVAKYVDQADVEIRSWLTTGGPAP